MLRIIQIIYLAAFFQTLYFFGDFALTGNMPNLIIVGLWGFYFGLTMYNKFSLFTSTIALQKKMVEAIESGDKNALAEVIRLEMKSQGIPVEQKENKDV